MSLFSSVPVFQHSHFSDPVSDIPYVPVFRCPCFQMFLFSIVPVSQFLFTNVHVFNCSFFIFRCSSFLVSLFSSVPVFQCSYFFIPDLR